MMAATTMLITVVVASPSDPTMAEMRWHRRVVIMSTDGEADAQFLAQRRNLSRWPGADDRDVSVVSIVGDAVSGSREAASVLRARYGLPPDRFSIALIGKDGHVALLSRTALTGAQLQGTIDAMPMRKAGRR